MGAALANIEPNQRREDVSTECLSLYKRNSSKFLRRFIIVDETWVHHYTPESKKQSKQWTPRGEPATKKSKLVQTQTFKPYSNKRQKMAQRRKILDNGQLVDTVNGHLEHLDKSFYQTGITATLEHRWVKCIELKEDYVEK